MNAVELLSIINRLVIKAFNAKSSEDLSFIIVNDTVQAIKYDRAWLWSMEEKAPTLIAISGQLEVNTNSEVYEKWKQIISKLEDPSRPQILRKEQFSELKGVWGELFGASQPTIIWLPINVHGEQLMGLCLEILNLKKEEIPSPEYINILMNQLLVGYASAWVKFKPKFNLKEVGFTKERVLWGSLIAAMLLVIVPVHLRVTAPCEVVPKKTYMVTAPLEGLIEKVDIRPGQLVKKGTVLFEYDRKVYLQELASAQKQVQGIEAELSRAITLGYKDENFRNQIEILTLQLQKEKLALDFIKNQVGNLVVKATIDGIVSIDDPDQWQGKPVKIGERVLALTDQKETKVKFWIPEADNVVVDPSSPVKVILKVDPKTSYDATLDFISDEASLSAQHQISFLAEAEWNEQPANVKVGMTGTSVLYGQRVPLIYFILRKPIFFLRNLFEI